MPSYHHPFISRSFHRNSHPCRTRVSKSCEYNSIRYARREHHTWNDESRHRLSYFDRLPLELKVEIFTECLASYASYPSLSAKDVPLLLCRVSSSWRAVVQSTPKLWARFDLNVPNFGLIDPTHNQSGMNALNLWLERSRNSELSFRITHNPAGSIPDSRSAHLLAALIPDAHRWKDVDLHVPSSSIEPLQHSSLGVLPALRSVTLDMKGLWRSRVPFDVQALGIPWGQLSTLSLDFDFHHLLTLDRCLDILSQCASLSRCSVNADCKFSPHSRLSHRLTLPKLNHFKLMLHWGEQFGITDRAESCLISFLEQLEFPQLQSLSLQWLVTRSNEGGAHWSEVHPRFLSMLDTVAPTLRTLALAYFPFTDVEMIESLMRLHNLSHLDLRFSLVDREHDPITDAFLSACALEPDGPSPGILPLLESIYLQCYGARHTVIHVTNFIQSRTPVHGDVNLRSFRLVSVKPVAAPTRQVLEEWSEKGLEVSMDQVVIR